MKKLYLITLILICTSCATVIWQQLWDIKKGMTYNEVIEILESELYGKGIEIISDLNQDTHDLSLELSNNSKVLLTYKYYTKNLKINNTYYAFYFKEDKLVYWGMIHEFARHSNNELNQVAEELSKIIGNKYED